MLETTLDVVLHGGPRDLKEVSDLLMGPLKGVHEHDTDSLALTEAAKGTAELGFDLR
jgi:hypothetical protein